VVLHSRHKYYTPNKYRKSLKNAKKRQQLLNNTPKSALYLPKNRRVVDLYAGEKNKQWLGIYVYHQETGEIGVYMEKMRLENSKKATNTTKTMWMMYD